jgi:hypothetical protein
MLMSNLQALLKEQWFRRDRRNLEESQVHQTQPGDKEL